ncbi:MAG: cyclopropane fatty acyl phospholipid synthase [Candidatus Moranbacteria bacterium]|nr:cyclopropane fatty acyl phospholipid synthase [Candidatus Moranbacteria bacterium]
MTLSLKEKSQKILAEADIQINGDRPWDVTVHDERFYRRVLFQGSIGLGESYMDGWWDVKCLDEFFTRVLHMRLDKRISQTGKILQNIASVLFNRQSRARATIVAREHYDLSTELYTSFLDPYNQYTCGYFKNTENLNVAQEQKLDLICKKLRLKPGDRVLDIGCGWGGFAKYAALHFGVSVTGITISKEQLAYAKKFTKGLPVELRLQDYRDLKSSFNKILVCGMIEHVGYKNYRELMRVVYRNLTDDGIFLLHTIGGNETTVIGDPWFDKYIFPNGMFPSISQIGKAIEGLFVMEDWHNFGADYDKTLMVWFANFDTAWPRLKDKYDERFYRMWKYYLLCVAGAFRARDSQLWQIVLSKNGVHGGYQTVR